MSPHDSGPDLPAAARLKVLISATSRTQESLLARALEKQGIEAHAGHGGDPAEAVPELKADVAVISASLLERYPESLNALRGSSETAHVRLVIMTSSVDQEHGTRTLAEADALLSIPFEPEQLISVIHELVEAQKTILLVDDSATIRKSLKRELASEGYRVLTAADGEEGVKMALERLPDLVISDVEMPRCDGYELCKRLRTAVETRLIPIVILSSRSSGMDIEKGFESGASEYLTKPVDMDELKTRLRDIFSGQELRRGEKVLVVEDSPVVLQSIAQSLTVSGLKVCTAEHGREALSIVEKESPDLVITDYEMPGMDGGELILKLREQPTTAKVPVIIISAHQTARNRALFARIRGVKLLAKPFSHDRLLALVERVLVEARLEREKQALRSYVSQDAWDAAQRAARSSTRIVTRRPGHEIRSILFSDLVGFTARCETMDPTELVELLNGYFDRMTEIIKRKMGEVDKFIGDAVLALFRHGKGLNGAEMAVEAALSMQESLAKFSAERSVDLKARIGINTGHVVVADIGGEGARRDYTVIGNNVNVAQRLESQAPHGGVLISKSTYECLGKEFDVEELPPLVLKGKQQPVVPYLVHGMPASRQALPKV